MMSSAVGEGHKELLAGIGGSVGWTGTVSSSLVGGGRDKCRAVEECEPGER